MLLSIYVIVVALSSTLALQGQSFAKIQSDLKNADSDTNSLAQAVRRPSGDPVPPSGGRTISSYITQLENDYVNCTADDRSGPVTYGRFRTLCSYVNGTLFSDTKAMLNAFVAKKTQFAAAGLKQIVIDDLNTLRSDTSSCLANIQVGGPIPQINPGSSPCQSVLASYSSAYASAISAYNS